MIPLPEVHPIHYRHRLIPHGVVDQFARTWLDRCSKIESRSSTCKAVELAPNIDDVQQALSVDIEVTARRRGLPCQRISRGRVLSCCARCGDVQRACDCRDRHGFVFAIGQETIGGIHCSDELGDQFVLSRVGDRRLSDCDS